MPGRGPGAATVWRCKEDSCGHPVWRSYPTASRSCGSCRSSELVRGIERPRTGELTMPLTPGTTLGPYSVTAKIGEGGMGEVWQATDTKLNRQVGAEDRARSGVHAHG